MDLNLYNIILKNIFYPFLYTSKFNNFSKLRYQEIYIFNGIVVRLIYMVSIFLVKW